MQNMLLIYIIPGCSALLCFVLAGFVLAGKRRPEHRWLAAVALTAGLWALGIDWFLLTDHDPTLAATASRFYYVMGALIPFCLIELALVFPRVRRWSPLAHVALVAGLAVAVYLSLVPHGVIDQIVLRPEGNIVTLNYVSYTLYSVYFFLYAAIAAIVLFRNYVELRYKKAEQRRFLIMILGMKIALLFGALFDLIFPLFGNYEYIWAGPPFVILFVGVTFYVIIRRGLFDIRDTLARSVGYSLLLIVLFSLYSAVVINLAEMTPGEHLSKQTTLLYVVIAIIVTLTCAPLKRWLDRLSHRMFYRDDYDFRDVSQRVSQVTGQEIELRALVKKTLMILDEVLVPEYVVAYVTDENHKLHQFKEGPGHITPHQRRMQLDVIDMMLDRLPRVVNQAEIASDGDDLARHVITTSGASMILQFVVQRERIGALFIGAKRNGQRYSDKDLQLLSTSTEELALAIENSLRFDEIEKFNETLKDRVADATKRLRKTNRELQRLDEAKDEFVSMASHQLRTPLTSIKGYISMVMEGDAGRITEQQRKLLGEAFLSSERMVHLIADFLSVSRLQTGKFILDKTSVDFGEIIRQEVGTMKPVARAHGQKLTYTAPVSRRMIECDEAKLRQVVMNFMDNAVYYSKQGGTIAVDLQYGTKELSFTVTDHGIGVPLAEQHHLFTKFFRATNGRRQRPDGTGVGLFLAKKIITAHGGHIIFQSKEGEGSTFGFRLPL